VAHFAHWFVFYQPKERDWQVTEGLGVRQLAAAFFRRSVGSASLLATTFSDTIAHFQLRNAETTAASWPYPVRLGWKAAASCLQKAPSVVLLASWLLILSVMKAQKCLPRRRFTSAVAAVSGNALLSCSDPEKALALLDL
jgi:hypothetical protein